MEQVLNTIPMKNYLMALGGFHSIHKFLILMEEFFQNNILYIDNIGRKRMVKYIKSNNVLEK
jgi:hypothetical protein